MTRRLLLVEPSATMRHVLEKHVRALGHEVEATDSYAGAGEALRRQYRAFESDIAGVLYGWPSLADASAEAFAARLESDEFADLPVVVLSTDMRAETRAWVAGRERTAVLAWKDYLGVDALLERLLDDAPDAAGERVAKFDNADIHVLVVDDSLTIRYSLRDLFELHGYRVSLAATRDEAIARARETRFDIAVLDFYLEETTGDVLCRDLVSDPACGDVVCAILTGTYADHVIKRSLRAGAVECMFKNESSELLLTRVDAIARFVRQRRELGVGLGRLERVVDVLGGALLVVDAEERVRHASAAALVALGRAEADAVVGQSVRALLGVERLADRGDAPIVTTWRDAAGEALVVEAERIALTADGESLLRFERVAALSVVVSESAVAERDLAPGTAGPPVPADEAPDVTPDASPDVPPEMTPTPDDPSDAMLARHGLPDTARAFVRQLERHRASVNGRPARFSLLVLGAWERDADGAHVPVDGELAARVETGLRVLYRREHHVAALGGHRFGLLIRHADAPQSFLLTRRLMQLADEMLGTDGGPALATTGCLVGLDGYAKRSSDLLLAHALQGLGIVEERGVDQALLLDLKRMLAVHPEPAPSVRVPATDGGPPEPDGRTTPSGPGQSSPR